MTRIALLVPARDADAVLGRLFDSIAAQTVPFVVRLGAQLSPAAAVMLREARIRCLKPHLRWRMRSAASLRRHAFPMGTGGAAAR